MIKGWYSFSLLQIRGASFGDRDEMERGRTVRWIGGVIMSWLWFYFCEARRGPAGTYPMKMTTGWAGLLVVTAAESHPQLKAIQAASTATRAERRDPGTFACPCNEASFEPVTEDAFLATRPSLFL